MIDNRSTLPLQLQNQLHECDNIILEIKRQNSLHPKRGPKPWVSQHAKRTTLMADTEKQFTDLLQALAKALGPKMRGNKRWGRLNLYAELVAYFYLLRQNRITLPKNKNLSKLACQYGLGGILRRHGCIKQSDMLLMKNSIERNKVAGKMDRIFSRIAHAVDNTPA